MPVSISLPSSKTIFDPAYSRLIQQLKQARLQAGVSQAELASRIGRPQSYIAKYEASDRRLDVLEFIVVARALNLRASDLIIAFETENE